MTNIEGSGRVCEPSAGDFKDYAGQLPYLTARGVYKPSENPYHTFCNGKTPPWHSQTLPSIERAVHSSFD